MKAALVALALLVALAAASARSQQPETRFRAVDVIVDAGGEPLAAWQVELRDARGCARWTAVEGGESPAYRDAPRYDPRALAGGRIVLAALRVDGPLPVGPTRVATVHYALEGACEPELVAVLVAAADADGRRLAGEVVLR